MRPERNKMRPGRNKVPPEQMPACLPPLRSDWASVARTFARFSVTHFSRLRSSPSLLHSHPLPPNNAPFCNAAPQSSTTAALSDGVSIAFGSPSAYSPGDVWTFNTSYAIMARDRPYPPYPSCVHTAVANAKLVCGFQGLVPVFCFVNPPKARARGLHSTLPSSSTALRGPTAPRARLPLAARRSPLAARPCRSLLACAPALPRPRR